MYFVYKRMIRKDVHSTPNTMCIETPTPMIIDQPEDNNNNPEINAEYIRTAIEGALGDKYEIDFDHAHEHNGQVEVHFFTAHYEIGVVYNDIDDDNEELAGTFAFMYHAPVLGAEMVGDSAFTIEDLIQRMDEQFQADRNFQNRFHPMFPDYEDGVEQLQSALGNHHL